MEERGLKSERQSGWCEGRRASLGKLSGLGSVKIDLTDLNVIQELVKGQLEFKFSSVFFLNIQHLGGPIVQLLHHSHIEPK